MTLKNLHRRLLLLVITAIYSATTAIAQQNKKQPYAGYLFTYFNGEGSQQEAIRFALSKDGYHFNAINQNKPIIVPATGSSSGGVRDPHILRAEDGKTFYMVATDMNSVKNGWEANHAMVLMQSTDLINWRKTVVNIPQTFKKFADVNRVWAPQTIYDSQAGKYMIYWSMRFGKGPDVIYYSYANKDFTGLETEPRQLFFEPNNGACIDADIVVKDGKYHLFYKTESDGLGIRIAKSDKLTSGYVTNGKFIQQTKDPVEGASTFKLNDGSGYILMYDVYTKGRYQFTKTTDLENFKVVDQEVTMDFKPRHGTVIPITAAEMQRLQKHFSNVPKTKLTAFEPGSLWYDNKGVHINAHGGGMLYQNGTYYWYGEHKVEGDAGNRAMVGVHCYSSKDLYNWSDEGIALPISNDSTSDIAKGCILERPKVVYNAKTRKYVMWFHLELRGQGYKAARAGVAVSDKPTGPFRYIKSYRPNPGVMPFYPAGTPASEQLDCKNTKNESETFFCRDLPGGQMARDMTVFVDDDGKAYHIFSSEENATLHIAELTADYTGHTGKFVRVYPDMATEAPAIFKRKGTYYLIGSGTTGWAPNPARWLSAKSILGPWIFHGNPCIGDKANITFGGQSTYVLPVAGKPDSFIFMADKWAPKNAIDGRYIWLPIRFDGDNMIIEWKEKWSL
ncbi:family 43 glycosylhydrolase [Mucilaginibacter pallidiroseus]|uniref:Family 43 glycosylhydrolase n=1 Tax=Mucilaginibacter pallidiroseus TaxID=2599295 RepID=A0A563U2X3_9SPHI|nr:family 43 glycosylhydrolase [Mucilaginibacter pallidiroseus]TWR25696.1 family 43 glycosylhydrolase [Mucilaginibacter pallidiroseus]